jgi:hypothetical protein
VRGQRILWAAGVLLTLLALAGCGDDKNGQVSGTVQVDGEPVAAGAILFVPVDGQTATAGGEIKDGRYSIKVPVGNMKVSLSAPKVVGKKKIYPTENSPIMPITVEALPAKYNEQTELRLDVKPGKNEKDWDLRSK